MTPRTNFSVYVAASAAPAESARVRAAIANLKAAGIRVTCTWPETVAAVGDANPRGAAKTERLGWAVQDLSEIDAAHAVWFLVPATVPTRGAWFEVGYGYSENKHLVFSGDTLQSVFCALGHEFQTDTGALQHLKVLAGLDELATNAPQDWPGTEDLR